MRNGLDIMFFNIKYYQLHNDELLHLDGEIRIGNLVTSQKIVQDMSVECLGLVDSSSL